MDIPWLLTSLEERRSPTVHTHPTTDTQLTGELMVWPGMLAPKCCCIAPAVTSQLCRVKRQLKAGTHSLRQCVICPDFSLESTGFFPGKQFIHFLVLKMNEFRDFVLHNCILVFDSEQVYLKLQVTNLKNKEAAVNPKPQTLEKKLIFENLIP